MINKIKNWWKEEIIELKVLLIVLVILSILLVILNTQYIVSQEQNMELYERIKGLIYT